MKFNQGGQGLVTTLAGKCSHFFPASTFLKNLSEDWAAGSEENMKGQRAFTTGKGQKRGGADKDLGLSVSD